MLYTKTTWIRKGKGVANFHALTGCDQTSTFANQGKRTAWDTLKMFEVVTVAFSLLSCSPSEEKLAEGMPVVEQLVVLTYDRTSECTTVNKARMDLFSRK